jgi:2-iminobutanoate/2-iminopropanoate deaminase
VITGSSALKSNSDFAQNQHMPRSRVQLELYEPIGPYSRAVIAGGQLFISATAGVDPASGTLAGADAYAQTRQVLTNIQSILSAAGATLDDLVHLQVNLLNMQDFSEMNHAYADFFSEPYPARTVLGVSALPKPGALLTMNAIAVLRTA